MKKVLLIITILLVAVTGCGKDTSSKTKDEKFDVEETTEVTNYVSIKVEGYKEEIIAELYPEVAPITVENFQNLVSSKFYDGIIFHRVINNFMIQTGDPTGTGYGGSPKKIKGEFKQNGYDNNLKHERGVLSMARNSVDMDSASSQFFIVQKTSPNLDGQYAAFGNVLSGMDVVDSIAEVETNPNNDKPLTDIKIESIRFVNIKK